MEIIDIRNGNDIVATSIRLSEEERQSIEKTIGVMKSFETIATDSRDVFEFKYSQKLLKAVLGLDTVEGLTASIDAILLDPDLIDDIGVLAPELDDNEITAITEIAEAVAGFWDKFVVASGGATLQPLKKDTPDKKKKKESPKIEEKYEQLSIDFSEDCAWKEDVK